MIDLRKRLQVLEDIDKTLVDLNLFNQELVVFDSVLTELDNWISGPAQERLDSLRRPDSSDHAPDPEEKVTRAMELMEDLLKRINTCTKVSERGAGRLWLIAVLRPRRRRWKYSRLKERNFPEMRRSSWRDSRVAGTASTGSRLSCRPSWISSVST